MKIKNNLDKIVTILLIVIIAIFGFINRNKIKEFDNTASLKSTEEVETRIESFLETKAEDEKPVQTKIYVDISGCITNPGVYEMDHETRINDLVEKAGGLCKEADIESINLSQKLEDEMKIHVYKIGENSSKFEETTSRPTKAASNKVNINKADLSELTTLPGIGKSRAEEIISYRNTNRFKSIEDIKNISGIGEKIYEKLKDKISIN
ncbi:helix-hairpin-helix domain-containing protein [uncultured Helcococcus sp.]|uniref:helix-hairpin-helix domain-containing protein n=1 Tax=uncultured Helcococcus sp. TaxID=1072508 RepID=UPI00288B4956|nr:helix-hairpin-helix domain-containing protein [uncultured Helcococcus sp.]